MKPELMLLLSIELLSLKFTRNVYISLPLLQLSSTTKSGADKFKVYQDANKMVKTVFVKRSTFF